MPAASASCSACTPTATASAASSCATRAGAARSLAPRLTSCPRVLGHSVAGGDAVVVEPQQRDHVADVGLVLDPPGSRSLLPREDRVVDDPAVLEQLAPD